MSESENVLPRRSAARRDNTEFLPPNVVDVLTDCQARVFEALAIAKLVGQYYETGSNPYDVSPDRAIDAMIRVLQPVEGLGDELWLKREAEKLAAARDGGAE